MLFRSDRKSTRLNSSHTIISYAVFCLKKKKNADCWCPLRLTAPAPVALPPSRRRWLVAVRSHPACVSQALLSALAYFFFFLNERAPPEISPLPLHAPLPI